MKKLLINISLSILFTISIILSIISLTLLNDDYIIKIFKHYDIYSYISDNIKDEYKELNKTVDFDTDEVRRDIDTYISNRYQNSTTKDNNHVVYYNHIFFMKNNNIKKVSYLIYLVTIVFIIVTGNIFLHSKRYHHIDIIFFISSIFLILLSGYISIFISLDNYIFDKVIYVTNHILLAVGVILFELNFLKYTNLFIYKKILKKE